MRWDLRPLVSQLLWIREYPAYHEAPVRFALRSVRYGWREHIVGDDVVAFEACDGCRFETPRNNVSSYIAAVFGQRDLNIARFWRRVLPEGAVVFDIGANIGLYTVPASLRVGAGGRVFGFEAHPWICGFLRGNVARNCNGNVTVENLAVGDSSGEIRIALNSRNIGETHVAVDDEAGEKVPIVSLDDYCARNRVGRIDYVKIDVEGYEANVLRGARRVLAANEHILIQTEYEPLHRARYGRASEMAELLADLGFRPHSVDWVGGIL